MDYQAAGGADTYESESNRCIPKTGSYADSPSYTTFLGFATSGVQLWYYTTSNGGDAVALETLDSCGGHASPTNKYHYHGVIISYE